MKSSMKKTIIFYVAGLHWRHHELPHLLATWLVGYPYSQMVRVLDSHARGYGYDSLIRLLGFGYFCFSYLFPKELNNKVHNKRPILKLTTNKCSFN